MDGWIAAADAATGSGASAAAAAAPVHEWKDIRAYCKKHPQKSVMNNYAHKYLRWSFEDPFGVPCIPGGGRILNFDLTRDTFRIFIAHHQENGPAYWFDSSCEEQPWSWRHLLVTLPQLWQSPVVSLRFVAIPGTTDHKRMVNEWEKFEPGVRPPVWNFVVGLQDGTMWRLRPRYRGNKVDIQKWDGEPITSPVPAKGAGKSDGPGTQAHYGPDHGQMYYETGLDPTLGGHRANHLAAKGKAKAAPAAAGSVQPSSASAPAVGSQQAPVVSAPVAAGRFRFFQVHLHQLSEVSSHTQFLQQQTEVSSLQQQMAVSSHTSLLLGGHPRLRGDGSRVGTTIRSRVGTRVGSRVGTSSCSENA